MYASIDDTMLRAYLAETLPPGDSARVEKALRESAELRARLEDVRADRVDNHVHTLGAIWRRRRLTCASRERLGSYLLEALEPDLMSYISFHIDVIECPFCRANLEDLRAKAAHQSPVSQTRRSRIFEGSRHLLSGDPY
jgi:hypothetical protein